MFTHLNKISPIGPVVTKQILTFRWTDIRTKKCYLASRDIKGYGRATKMAKNNIITYIYE